MAEDFWTIYILSLGYQDLMEFSIDVGYQRLEKEIRLRYYR